MQKTQKQLNSLGNLYYPRYLEYKPNPENYGRMQSIDVNEEKRIAFIEGIKLGLQLSNNKTTQNEN